jgi:Flp pilus assembly protein TadD
VVAPAGGDYATLLEAAKRARGRRAEAAWREAIAANPNGSEALSALAFLLLNRSQFAEAAELSRRATAIDPTDSRAWITLGAALESGRPPDRAGAREAYRNCVERGQGAYVRDCRMMNR